jgi:hypothetical protein
MVDAWAIFFTNHCAYLWVLHANSQERMLNVTYLHKPSAALDALAALAGVKSGWQVYFSRMRSMICVFDV